MDGMILPDVPFEEKEEFASVAEKYGLDLISLIAPTSYERISMIAKEAEGFCLLCIFTWSYRYAKSDHDGYWSYGGTG